MPPLTVGGTSGGLEQQQQQPHTPRVILYYQTHHFPSTGKFVSVLPLLTNEGIGITHILVAAIHINSDPGDLTLNDHRPSDLRFDTMWAEMRVLQASGVKVMGMLGGAAHGSFERLDFPRGVAAASESESDSSFERYYRPLRDMIRAHALDGLDLDVEEHMSLAGVVRLIDRLRADHGGDFLITLSPVASAMLGDHDPRANLSGFGYAALDALRGSEVAWYNTQFYCGWGDCSNPAMYELILSKGWSPEKIVVGLITNPANGPGWVPWEAIATVLPLLAGRRARFGGVIGWEYFNALPGGEDRPWEWAMFMTALVRGERAAPAVEAHRLLEDVGREAERERENEGRRERERAEKDERRKELTMRIGAEVDPDEDADDDGDDDAAAAPVPDEFDYYSDGHREIEEIPA